jgi:hypothetical protein
VERTTEPPIRGAVELPEVKEEEEEAPREEVAPDMLDIKREEYTFPADAKTRFSTEILNGYIFDHVLTDSEKRAYLKPHPTTLPFAKRLYVEGTDYVVLGKDTFEPPEPPIGEELSAYKAWNAALLSTFIVNKNTLFASLKKGKLTISKMTVDGETPKRKLEKGGKKFEPIVCDTGENTTGVMNTFAKYIDAKGVGLPTIQTSNKPAKQMTGPQRCVYIELLAREEHRCVWVTPEELSVLYDGKAKKGQAPTNQDTFTDSFRK